MPHLTLEYTNNLAGLDPAGLLLQLNQALAASGHFEEIDIKSRALPLDTFLIGTSLDEKAFIHVKLAILSGRSVEAKRELSHGLLEVLQPIGRGLGVPHLQLCAEILEIERDSYAKASLVV